MLSRISYDEIQVILDKYRAKKNFLTRLFPEPSHIAKIRVALEKSMKAARSELLNYHSAILPEINLIPSQLNSTLDYVLIGHFANFLRRFKKVSRIETNDKLNGEILRDIEFLIRSSKGGRLAEIFLHFKPVIEKYSLCGGKGNLESIIKFMKKLHKRIDKSGDYFQDWDDAYTTNFDLIEIVTALEVYYFNEEFGKFDLDAFAALQIENFRVENLRTFKRQIEAVVKNKQELCGAYFIYLRLPYLDFNDALQFILTLARVSLLSRVTPGELKVFFNHLMSITMKLKWSQPENYKRAMSNYLESIVMLQQHDCFTTENLKQLFLLVPDSLSVFKTRVDGIDKFNVMIPGAGRMTQDQFMAMIIYREVFDCIDYQKLSLLPPNFKGALLFEMMIRMCQIADSAVVAIETINKYIGSLRENNFRPAPRVTQAQLQAFNLVYDNQSTHIASVHRSASLSALKLKEYYSKNGRKIDVLGNIKAFREKITIPPDLQQVQLNSEDAEVRQTCLEICSAVKIMLMVENVIRNESIFTDPVSKVNIAELLAMAIESLNELELRAFVKPSGDVLTVKRKDAQKCLIRGLYEILRGGNLDENGMDMGGEDSPICASGAFNKILESMVSVNNLVEIQVIPKEYALARLNEIIVNEVENYLSVLLIEKGRVYFGSLLEELHADNLAVILPVITIKSRDVYVARFGQLYMKDDGSLDEQKVMMDVEGAAPYVDLTEILVKFETLLHSPSPAAIGFFAQEARSGQTASQLRVMSAFKQ